MTPATAAIAADHVLSAPAGEADLATRVGSGDDGQQPLLQASAAVVGAFLPMTAVVFYLALSLLYIVEPLRHIPIRIRRPAQPG